MKVIVYVTSGDGHIHALVAATGEQLWRSQLEGGHSVPPIVTDGVIYAVKAENHVRAFATTDGKLLWSYQIDGEGVQVAGSC